MKSKCDRWLAAAVCALSMFAISGAAEAYCRWVPTHYVNGYRVSGHQVCGHGYGYGRGYGYSSVRCQWVPGHWKNGYWRDGHRVCWRR
jgi:hypothetical protein